MTTKKITVTKTHPAHALTAFLGQEKLLKQRMAILKPDLDAAKKLVTEDLKLAEVGNTDDAMLLTPEGELLLKVSKARQTPSLKDPGELSAFVEEFLVYDGEVTEQDAKRISALLLGSGLFDLLAIKVTAVNKEDDKVREIFGKHSKVAWGARTFKLGGLK